MGRIFFLIWIIAIIEYPLFAGVIDITDDAPVLFKTASWLLTFLSQNIQSQAIVFTTWFVTLMVAIQAIARGIAELLGLFANKTKTDADNKVMSFMSKLAEISGKIIGWFGVGYPKSLK